MKVAILITGHIRTWSECKNNFLESFNHLKPDVFVSTYDLQYNYHPAGQHWMGGIPDTYLSTREIESLFKEVNTIVIDVEKIESVYSDYTDRLPYIETNFKNDLHTFLQYRKISRAIQFMKNYENEINSKYDVVIKIRSDIYHNKFDCKIGDNSVIVDSGNLFPNDVFIASMRDNFIKLIEFINSEFYNQIYSDSHLRPPHNLLLCGCKHFGLDINVEDLMQYVLRRTGKNYYNNIK